MPNVFEYISRVKKIVASHWDAGLIFALWLALVVTNYTPGTWLLGWDNLVPEFDLWLNLKRSLFAAWQENQGLGLVGGIGHASELTRQLLLVPLVAVLPASAVRYAWTFGMLLLGPLGVLKLAQFFLGSLKLSLNQRKISSCIGACFYLLNIATVQYFFVQLEAFSGFYGFLPWLMWSAITFLDTGSKRQLALYGLISILATSAFHVQTLFVVYGLLLSIFCAAVALRDKLVGLQKIVRLLGVTFIMNAFWLLPVAYFTFTNSDMTVFSKQNLFSTPEAQLMNEHFGTLGNIFLLKGYWFEYTDFIQKNTQYLLGGWRDHYAKSITQIAGYILTIPSFLAVFYYSMVKHVVRRSHAKVEYLRVGVFFALVATLLMLTAGNGLFGAPFRLLTDAVPLFGQMFRVAFTKWSIAAALFFAIGLSLLVGMLIEKIYKKIAEFVYLCLVLLFAAVTWTSYPMFTGQLLYDQVQVQLPSEYLQLFTYFDQQPSQARILHLPAETLWGWSFYSWGYRGSGFLWHGIKQPIIDRNFDVWSQYNESLYFQLQQALINSDVTAFAALVEKYQISYILLDKNKVLPSQKEIDFEKIATLLNSAGWTSEWNNQNLVVYVRTNSTVGQSFVSIPATYTQSANTALNSYTDPLFLQSGNYVTFDSVNENVVYPFNQLVSSKPLSALSTNETTVTLPRIDATQHSEGMQLILPELSPNDRVTPFVTISYSDAGIQLLFDPIVIVTTEPDLSTTNDFGTFPEVLLPVPANVSSANEIYLLINNQAILVQKYIPTRQQLTTLVPTELFTIGVVDSALVQESNESLLFDANTIESTYISEEFWSTVSQPQHITLSSEQLQTLNVTLSSLTIPILENSKLLKADQPTNCDVFKRGSNVKEVSGKSVTFLSSEYGGVCDGLYLPGMMSNSSYFLKIQATPVRGRSLRFYLERASDNSITLEDIVPSDSTLFSVEGSESDSSPYYLGIENKSFGQPSENILNSVESYAIPVTPSWLSSISLSAPNHSIVQKNTIEATSVKKFGPFLYVLDIPAVAEEGIFQLSQAYDAGWWAITLRPFGNTLQHGSSNGWANSWIVPTGTTKIVVVFLPQLFIFIGIVVLIGCIIPLAKVLLKRE